MSAVTVARSWIGDVNLSEDVEPIQHLGISFSWCKVTDTSVLLLLIYKKLAPPARDNYMDVIDLCRLYVVRCCETILFMELASNAMLLSLIAF